MVLGGVGPRGAPEVQNLVRRTLRFFGFLFALFVAMMVMELAGLGFRP